MEITIKEVERLADLSALKFSDDEKQKFIGDFNNILEMVNQLQKAEVSAQNVFNRSHKLSELREDIAKPSFDTELILENAPKQRRNCFNVPLVVE
ncbi:MAG: Asp-tRNA(Asn)/Glu-tRNA(Gln) amidotransferase subunit GatC [Clostridia bacterium]|nr:Asp-tRNA(Asn)/Glu-tRNA(Gln) amidotransferase subunit GatC [Clostridia bacterium]